MSEDIDFENEMEQIKFDIMKELEMTEENAVAVLDCAVEEVYERLGRQEADQIGKRVLLKYIHDNVGIIVKKIRKERDKSGDMSELQLVLSRISGRDVEDEEIPKILPDDGIPPEFQERFVSQGESMADGYMRRKKMN